MGGGVINISALWELRVGDVSKVVQFGVISLAQSLRAPPTLL
jgi:hypothetical protein